MSPFRAWLELMRLSNAPTIITNVLVGWAVAKQTAEEDILGLAVGGITLAMLLFYAGGMILNDVADVEIDRRERAGRPIPSGRIGLKTAGFISLCGLGGGFMLIAALSRTALIPGFALLLCIVAYNLWHKKYAAAALLMGLCRGLVYVTVALALATSPDWGFLSGVAGVSTIYISGLTWFARSEGLFPKKRVLIPYLLAAICLFDALILFILGELTLALAAVGCFYLTRLGQQFISGT